MFQLTGYLSEPSEEIVSSDEDFLVTGCGHYKLLQQPSYHTVRPEGRADYQLLYVIGGVGEFFLETGLFKAGEGEGVLYRPGVAQDYNYHLSDGTDIYWMHFTGRRVEEILKSAGMAGETFHVRPRAVYPELFDSIIRELQLKRPGFSAICAGKGMELLSRIGRCSREEAGGPESRVEEILAYFHENFQKEIEVRQCARQFSISESWLIRCFRERTGMTPQRYLTGIRLNQAKELLASSSLNIGEIAGVVGYENALYFSRIFRKYVGASPREFRENCRKRGSGFEKEKE